MNKPKRGRRTKAQVEQLNTQMLAVLKQDHPQSVRHVFYRMTDPTLAAPVEKTDQGYVAVQRQLVHLRKDGTLPYGWIADHGRRGHFTDTFDSAADAVEATAKFYRQDVWRQASVYCEVWCESRSIAGVLHVETDRYAVPLYPAGGFSSLTLVYDSARYIEHHARARPVHILYVGDFDPAGLLIDKDIEKKLRGHLPNQEITFHRLAITRPQITLLGLPTKPQKKGDRRGNFRGGTVEAEAMPAGTLRKILREKIEEFLPERHLQTLLTAEESEREYLESIAQAIRESREG